MVSIFRETNIYKKKIEESCVTRTTMLLSSTQGISKSIVRVFFFFFFETILFNLQKKKRKMARNEILYESNEEKNVYVYYNEM